MKTAGLIILLTATALLTSCGNLWMTMYRAKGGYYKQEHRTERTRN